MGSVNSPAFGIDVRRAADRYLTRTPWLESWHSFSFGSHYDPTNVHHGVLVVNNDDTVPPGGGFDSHAHSNMEIVTWVLEGSLMHQDSAGNAGVIRPGLAQRMTAGTGILHSERNAGHPDGGPPDLVRFVQMWVTPDEPGLEPGYEQREVADLLRDGDLVTVASGMSRDDTAPMRIHNRRAAFHVARLGVDAGVVLPDAAYVHLFVATGAVRLEDAGELGAGDAARLWSSGARALMATADAEVLVWEMHASLGG
jgi:redox-sensitive bicupin YhaK (pirin superfamily)